MITYPERLQKSGSVFTCIASFCSLLLLPSPLSPRIGRLPGFRNRRVIRNGRRSKVATTPSRLFVVYPETSRKTPVVLVIHENMGLTDWGPLSVRSGSPPTPG